MSFASISFADMESSIGSRDEPNLPPAKKSCLGERKFYKGKIITETSNITWKIPYFDHLLVNGSPNIFFSTETNKWMLHYLPFKINCNCNVEANHAYIYLEALETITRNTFVTATFEFLSVIHSSHEEKEIRTFSVVFRPLLEKQVQLLGMLNENSVYYLQDKNCSEFCINFVTTFATCDDKPNESTYKDLEFTMYAICDPNSQPDLTIVVGDKEVSKVHSKRLCEMSEVFNCMFKTDTLEKRSRSINITDFSEDIVQRMAFFINNSVVPLSDVLCLTELIRIADKYDLGKLKETCEAILLCDMTLTNVIEILNGIDVIGSQTILKELAIHFIVSDMTLIYQRSRLNISMLNLALFHEIWKECENKHEYSGDKICNDLRNVEIDSVIELSPDNTETLDGKKKYFGNLVSDEIIFTFNAPQNAHQSSFPCQVKSRDYCTFKLHYLPFYNRYGSEVSVTQQRMYLEAVNFRRKLFCLVTAEIISPTTRNTVVNTNVSVFCPNKGINLVSVLNKNSTLAYCLKQVECKIKINVTYADVKTVTKQNWRQSEPCNRYLCHYFEIDDIKNDINVVAGETTIAACSQILSNYPAFLNLIDSAKKENKSCIEIPDFTDEVVRGMIDFTKKFMVSKMDLTYLLGLLEISHVYGLTDLSTTCEALLLDIMDESNVFEILNKIISIDSCSKILKMALHFAIDNADYILSTDEMFLLNPKFLEKIWRKLAFNQYLLKSRTVILQPRQVIDSMNPLIHNLQQRVHSLEADRNPGGQLATGNSLLTLGSQQAAANSSLFNLGSQQVHVNLPQFNAGAQQVQINIPPMRLGNQNVGYANMSIHAGRQQSTNYGQVPASYPVQFPRQCF